MNSIIRTLRRPAVFLPSPTPANMPSLVYDPSLRGARLIVYRDVLINLSQDSQVPPFKVLGANAFPEYGSAIDASAIVQFQEFGWITKQIVVGCNVPEPEYKQATGNAMYGWADLHGTFYANRAQIPPEGQC